MMPLFDKIFAVIVHMALFGALACAIAWAPARFPLDVPTWGVALWAGVMFVSATMWCFFALFINREWRSL